MLPQSSKKGIGTLRQITGRYPSHVFVPNYLNTSFVNKFWPIFFEKQNFLTPVQHGFRSKHSCESQLLITTDEFIQNFEGKTQTDVVVLDFSKAFDVVPHQRLLHKLNHYGIRGTTLNWIQNFLTNRTQKVVVDGSSSESARVKSGVPQGIVLGPLLFLTYINDLPPTVSSQVRLFADDCLLYRPIKCWADQEKLQRPICVTELVRSMGDVLQPLEMLGPEVQG